MNVNINPFVVDDERRLAHRSELKRKLAEIAVKKDRIRELNAIVTKLNADSDAAADEHQSAAGALQAELDKLDAEQIDNVLAGTVVPAKSTKRRGEILQRLADLNQTLEMRCEANRRSVEPLERQIDQLRTDTTGEAASRKRLADLASPETRRQKLFVNLKLRAGELMLAEAKRMVTTLTHNADIRRENARRGYGGDDALITTTRLSDWQSIADECEEQMTRLHSESRAVERTALAE